MYGTSIRKRRCVDNVVSRAIWVLRREGVRALFRKGLAYGKALFRERVIRGLELLLLPYAIFRIKRLGECTLDRLLDFAFNGLFGMIRPAQVRGEISELLKIVSELRPKTVLEIGTARGGTLFLFSRAASEDATIIGIDLPGGRFGGGYPWWKVPLYRSFALPRQRIYLLRTDSHKEETLERVEAILSGEKLDFLFIDGDHTYEGVKRDFEMYGKLVRGVIAFHDIVPHPPETGCEVSKSWNEIKHSYRHLEIIEDRSQRWAEIGVLYV